MAKSHTWDGIAQDNCTCQGNGDICRAHYDLWMSTHLGDLETMARNFQRTVNSMKELEVKRKKHVPDASEIRDLKDPRRI